MARANSQAKDGKFPSTHSHRRTVLVLLLAFTVRMVNLCCRPLWYDEAFAVLYASLPVERMLYGTVTPVTGAGAADVHPLLYYSLLHSWMELAGSSPLAVRFLSLGLGMLTVALLARLASWCFDPRTGWTVALLAAVHPFHVAYSQETRMYALLGLAAVTAAWALLRALEQGTEQQEPESQLGLALQRWKWWILYAVSAAFVLYSHNLGALVLLALNVLALVQRCWRRVLPSLFVADAAALALYGPWLVGVLPGQLRFVQRGYWLSPPGAEELVRAIMLPLLTFYEPSPVWLLAVALFLGLSILALLALRAVRTRTRATWFLLLCWLPVISLLLISRWRPLYLERALLPSALFYLVAIGWLLARGGLPRPIRTALVGLLLATNGAALGIHYTYAEFPRPPFATATAELANHVRPTDRVVHTNKLTYFPMHYYEPNLPAAFLADPPGSPQDTLAGPTQEALGIFASPTITVAVGSAERVWLVYFPREMTETRAMGENHPALAWLEDRFVPVEQTYFNDLVAALYRREGE